MVQPFRKLFGVNSWSIFPDTNPRVWCVHWSVCSNPIQSSIDVETLPKTPSRRVEEGMRLHGVPVMRGHPAIRVNELQTPPNMGEA